MVKKTRKILPTIGWAILVIAIIIIALSYFEVLTPDIFLTEKCILSKEVPCLDFEGTATGINLVIRNKAGFDISDIIFSVTGRGCIATTTEPSFLASGDLATYAFPCSPSPGKYKGTLTLTYTNVNTGQSQTKTGELIIQIA